MPNYAHSRAHTFQALIYSFSMPKVMRSSPVCEENENHHENRHEKKVLSDHDALLLLFPLTKSSMPP
jgi:hypothetical protein